MILNASSNYSDTCNYPKLQGPCGDICISDLDETCTCGNVSISTLNPGKLFIGLSFCCTPPSVQCRKTIFGVHCTEGYIIKTDTIHLVNVEKFNVTGTIPCNGKCINDYLTSKYLALYAHYTCPDKCVHWSGMCRGVSFCDGDEEMCGEDLRCPENVLKHTMPTVPTRSYCFGIDYIDTPLMSIAQNLNHIFGDLDENDGAYDSYIFKEKDVQEQVNTVLILSERIMELSTTRYLN